MVDVNGKRIRKNSYIKFITHAHMSDSLYTQVLNVCEDKNYSYCTAWFKQKSSFNRYRYIAAFESRDVEVLTKKQVMLLILENN